MEILYQIKCRRASFILTFTKKNIERIKYLKWCYDKLLLDTTNNNIFNLKSCSICCVDFGQNIESELRKLRPAIL